MKPTLIFIFIASLVQVSLGFAPATTHATATTRTMSQEPLYAFWDKKKVTKAEPVKVEKKKKSAWSFNTKAKVTAPEPAKKEVKIPAWKKGLQVAVTGSSDGVSLLGKPQFDWATGKPVKKQRAYDWSGKKSKK
mmetsp:Transcript_15868/g.19362  ORF Transcript_15868/g.19362 Transcript_15868/m.19362 type:complete len:134 (-) Transcript_15868:1705-2106(-)